MNATYTIRRSNLLRALNLSDKIPVGLARTWENVEVVTGDWDDSWSNRPEHHPRTTIILPLVRLEPKGIAKRLQVACPKCGAMMRFCGLQQHVDTAICKSRQN
jgi:hypothetical protein